MTSPHRFFPALFVFCSALLPAFAVTIAACSDDPSSTPSSSTSDAAADTSPETIGDGSSSSPGDGSPEASGDGGSDGSTGPLTTQEKLICDALASRSACANGAIVCEEDEKCIYGRIMLPEAASAWATCRGAPSCKGDDLCVAEAGRAVGGAAADQYTTDCLARRTACSNVFSDDYCTPGVYAYPNAGAGATTCLTEPCANIEACIDNLAALMEIDACK